MCYLSVVLLYYCHRAEAQLQFNIYTYIYIYIYMRSAVYSVSTRRTIFVVHVEFKMGPFGIMHHTPSTWGRTEACDRVGIMH
jgi:hypothetical protein